MKFLIFFVFFVVAAIYVTEGAVMKTETTGRDKRATDFGRFYDTDGRYYRNDYTGTYTPYAARFSDYTPTTGFGDYYRGTFYTDGRTERRFGERDDDFRGTDGRFYFRDRTFY